MGMNVRAANELSIGLFNAGGSAAAERGEFTSFSSREDMLKDSLKKVFDSFKEKGSSDCVLIFSEARDCVILSADKNTDKYLNISNKTKEWFDELPIENNKTTITPYNGTQATFKTVLSAPDNKNWELIEEGFVVVSDGSKCWEAEYRQMPVVTLKDSETCKYLSIITVQPAPNDKDRKKGMKKVVAKKIELDKRYGNDHQTLLMGDLNMFGDDEITKKQEKILEDAGLIDLTKEAKITGFEGLSDQISEFSFVAACYDIYPGLVESAKSSDSLLMNSLLGWLSVGLMKDIKQNNTLPKNNMVQSMAALSFEEKIKIYAEMADKKALKFPMTGKLDRVFATKGVEPVGDVNYHLFPNKLVDSSLESYATDDIGKFCKKACEEKKSPFPSDHLILTATIKLK
ncbi:hypothetical protein N9V90_03015 [Endozoicomonas sp.]|nr:hypothetical protein [Endozoicomonas sp.]